jgi:hypothetical protein
MKAMSCPPSWIIEDMRITSQVGSRKFFYLDSDWSIWTRNSYLVTISNFELNKHILNNIWLLLGNLEVILEG